MARLDANDAASTRPADRVRGHTKGSSTPNGMNIKMLSVKLTAGTWKGTSWITSHQGAWRCRCGGSGNGMTVMASTLTEYTEKMRRFIVASRLCGGCGSRRDGCGRRS